MTSQLEILERSFRRIGFPESPGTIHDMPFSGVYLLTKARDIVYVGASKNIRRRLYAHGWKQRRRTSRDREFESAMWLALPRKVLPDYEGALLRALKPKLNWLIPQTRGSCDHEILYGLGLRETLSDKWIDWQEVA